MDQLNPVPRVPPHPHIHPNPEHYSARKLPQFVDFFCLAPEARRVTLVGDFNDWQPDAFPMKRQPDGNWHLQIPLNHGSHHYQFLVDGKPVLDPSQRVVRNESDEKVSLVEVI